MTALPPTIWPGVCGRPHAHQPPCAHCSAARTMLPLPCARPPHGSARPPGSTTAPRLGPGVASQAGLRCRVGRHKGRAASHGGAQAPSAEHCKAAHSGSACGAGVRLGRRRQRPGQRQRARVASQRAAGCKLRRRAAALPERHRAALRGPHGLRRGLRRGCRCARQPGGGGRLHAQRRRGRARRRCGGRRRRRSRGRWAGGRRVRTRQRAAQRERKVLRLRAPRTRPSAAALLPPPTRLRRLCAARIACRPASSAPGQHRRSHQFFQR